MSYLLFLANSIFLGIGLAMDAFSVCIANGLNENGMAASRRYKIAGVFGAFQALMPLVGWVCVRTIADLFVDFQKFIPWIALILLLYIGGKMIYEAIKDGKRAGEEKEVKEAEAVITNRELFVQGVATSIDALSVGFTIAEYSKVMAVLSALIIGIVTFVICILGLKIGKKAGEHFADKASVFGGIILICIGLEIFISHL